MGNSSAETRRAEEEVLPCLLFTIGGNIYAINSARALSIEILEQVTFVDMGNMVTAVAQGGSTGILRGGVIYRDQMIYLIETRKIFGLDSRIDEFEKNVSPTVKIRDHEAWVIELERCLEHRTPFLLTDDPHMCAFGRWFYSFETDNNVLRLQLNQIRGPHEAVHRTGAIVKKLMKKGEYQEAKKAFDHMKSTHYKKTIEILASLHQIIEENLKELFVVIETDNGLVGIIVDSIVGVEYPGEIIKLPAEQYDPRKVAGVWRRKKDQSSVILLNSDIFEETLSMFK